MDQNNQGDILKNVIGVAGPAILLAPVAAPVIHGISGIVVLGFGLYAAGAVISKTVTVLSSPLTPRDAEDKPPAEGA